MNKIPGWAYMIAGIAIMAYTKFIQSRQPTTKIAFFFWVGLAFVVFGIIREVAPRLKPKAKSAEQVGPPVQRPHHQAAPVIPHMTHQHVNPTQHPSHPYQPNYKQCPRCHQLTHGQGRFCHNCGHQFY
jgi:hypothetical protein